MHPLAILTIEDRDADFLYLQELLLGENYSLIHRHSVEEALSCDEKNYDLILLDLSLPDGQGLKTFESLNVVIRSKPIVVLTGLEDEDLAIEAVKLGAQDYILKRICLHARSIAQSTTPMNASDLKQRQSAWQC